MKRAFGLVASCVLAVASAGCERNDPARSAAPIEIQFTTSDGFRLAGTLFPARADGPRAPGLVLVHALGADRSAWMPFALAAQRRGYACMAYDVRGHGQSTVWRAGSVSYQSFDNGEWRDAALDIEAAHRELIRRGADPENTAVVGADIGAALALFHADRTDDIQALVMVSPLPRHNGLDLDPLIRQSGRRPVLLIAAEGDSPSASEAMRLKELAPGFSELRLYPGTAHGTDLLAASPNVIEEILLWLDPIIGETKKVP